MMKISELKNGSMRVNLVAVVSSIEEPREVNTQYGKTTVANAVIEDESGTINLVLWGDDASRLKQGDKIKMENGFVKEWNGELQLSAGRFGRIVVL